MPVGLTRSQKQAAIISKNKKLRGKLVFDKLGDFAQRAKAPREVAAEFEKVAKKVREVSSRKRTKQAVDRLAQPAVRYGRDQATRAIAEAIVGTVPASKKAEAKAQFLEASARGLRRGNAKVLNKGKK